MTRFLRVMRALVLGRPSVVVVLALFYVVGVLMVSITEPARRGAMIVVLSVIPTAGFFGIATERVLQYSLSSASLAVPNHARAMRQGQLGIVVLFLLAPLMLGIEYGGDPSWMMLLCVPAALGTLLAQYPRWAFVAWISLAVGAQISSRMALDWANLNSVWLRAALTIGSIIILGRWLRLADVAEHWSRFVFLGLADRKHERAATAAGQTAADSGWEQFQTVQGRHIEAVAQVLVRRGLTVSVLGAGLGFDVRPRPKAIVRMAGMGWAVLVAAQFVLRPESGTVAFAAIVALAAIQLAGSASLVHNAWKVRGPEEWLLTLTPRWPSPPLVKQVFVAVLLTSQISPWAASILIVAPVWAIGWIDSSLVGFAAVCLTAVSCASCGSVWFALAQRRAKDLSAGAIGLLLCGAVGVALIEWGTLVWPWGKSAGFAMILAPAIIGIMCLRHRPIQFPDQRTGTLRRSHPSAPRLTS